MKTVFNNGQEMAHIWANAIQEQGKNSNRSFYFEGDTIYSYGGHFPIAVIHGKNVLMTDRTYSNTTAKHIGYVRSAISHKKIIYCYDPFAAKYGNHSSNLEKFCYLITSQLDQITAKTRKPEKYLHQAQAKAHQAKEYLYYFEIKPSKDLKKIFELLDSENVVNQIKARSEKIENERKKKEAKRAKLQILAVKYWKNYTPIDDIPSEVKAEGKGIELTYLRTNGTEIETSKGIKLSIPKAKIYYSWVQSAKETGCKNCDYKIQDYKVTEVNDTYLIVGCHTIPHSEINEIANKLKF